MWLYFITTHPCTWPRAQNHTWENNNKSASEGFLGAARNSALATRGKIFWYKSTRTLHSSPTFLLRMMMISAFLKTPAKCNVICDTGVCVIWLLIIEGALVTARVLYSPCRNLIYTIWSSRGPKIVSQMCSLSIAPRPPPHRFCEFINSRPPVNV